MMMMMISSKQAVCLLLQVKFVDNMILMNVNIKDFFLYVFKELIDPKYGLLMYNDSNTLAWFPPKVNVFDDTLLNPLLPW